MYSIYILKTKRSHRLYSSNFNFLKYARRCVCNCTAHQLYTQTCSQNNMPPLLKVAENLRHTKHFISTFVWDCNDYLITDLHSYVIII